MVTENNLKTVFSVTEVVKELGLSRARFYQLQKMGVFPKPLFAGPKRPFYPLDLRQKCIDIRQTGVGYNGLPTVFYNLRKDFQQSCLNYERLANALQKINTNVTVEAVKKATTDLYRKGLPLGHDEGRVFADLVRYFDPGVQK
jgi:hypothetical protein